MKPRRTTYLPTPIEDQSFRGGGESAINVLGTLQEQVSEDGDNFRGLAYDVGDITIRSARQVLTLSNRIRQIELSTRGDRFKKGTLINTAPRATNNSTVGIPYVTIANITATDYSHIDRAATQVNVFYNRPSTQRNWAYAQVAVKNYRANPNWVYVATSTQSPVSFVLENTGETITVAVASMDTQGRINDISMAPTGSVVLSTNHQVNFSSVTFSVQPLTQSGTSTNILVASFTATFSKNSSAPLTVSYNSGSVDPGVYGTYYVYTQDGKLAGGTVTYFATTSNPVVTQDITILYLGKITTAGGGGGTGGGGGGGPCFVPGALVETPSGNVAIEALQVGDIVASMHGTAQVSKVLEHDYDGEVVIMPHNVMVTPDHRIWYGNRWRRAREAYFPVKHYKGKVYNLALEGEHNYLLENGIFAHNTWK